MLLSSVSRVLLALCEYKCSTKLLACFEETMNERNFYERCKNTINVSILNGGGDHAPERYNRSLIWFL